MAVFHASAAAIKAQSQLWRAVALASVVLCALLLLLPSSHWSSQSKTGSGLAGLVSPCSGTDAADEVAARPGGALPKGTLPMEFPRQETFEQLQADPSLVTRNASVLAQFAATPWLLPPRIKALKYAGVHKLDRLAQLRARPFGKYKQTITLLLFSTNVAVMLQNTIYSMVKFGGVDNYIVGTWTQADLMACADLNLPCADVSSLLVEPLEEGPPEEGPYTNRHDYVAVKWLRAILASHFLQRDYVFFYSDGDVAYTAKPVQESYMKLLKASGADGGFREGAFGSGAFMMLPTPEAKHLMANLTASAAAALQEGLDDQGMLGRLNEHAFFYCNALTCSSWIREQAAERQLEGRLAVLYAFPRGHYMVSDDECYLTRAYANLLDMCDWPVLYLHPDCTDFDGKKAIFQKQGMWFMDKESCAPREGTASQVHACQPLQWRVPSTEVMLYSCQEYGTGLVHDRPQLARAPQAPTADQHTSA